MKFYSEKLKRLFDTNEECVNAEKEYEKKLSEEEAKKAALKEAKKARAKEVEDAFTEVENARKKYVELRNAFVNDYGYYHHTYSKPEEYVGYDIFKDLFNLF